MATLREAYDKGCRRVCLACNTVFEPDSVRQEACEDGHGGRPIEMCACGCDLIGYIIEKEGNLYICPKNEFNKEECIKVKNSFGFEIK